MNVLYEGIRYLIESVYGICGDYGIAVVVITIIIRLCMIPLHRKQRKALIHQQTLNLQIEEIKNKYKNNTTKMNQEIEQLYQKEGNGGMGCLLSFIQLPIMIILYNGIRLAVVADVTIVLLPWVPSLLLRDSTYILPIITVFIQMFPQIFPYIGFFKELDLPKMSVPMVLILLFTNSWFASMIPAGIGLYYMVSGLCTSAEQVLEYVIRVKNIKTALIL